MSSYCYVNQLEDKREIVIKLIFEDRMERELTSELKQGDLTSHCVMHLLFIWCRNNASIPCLNNLAGIKIAAFFLIITIILCTT